MRIAPAIILLVLALGVVACTSQPQQVPPPQAAIPAQPTPQNTAQAALPAAPQVPLQNENPDVVQILANIGKVKSYSFNVARLPDGRAFAEYEVKGDKAKVTPTQALKLNGMAGDVIYLDFAQETAVAYCNKVAICPDMKRGVPVNFADYNITLPPQWAGKLRYGTKASKSLTFYDAPVTLVNYQEDGKYYEAYLHNFYGMPVRVAVATDQEMTNIVGGYEYRNIVFNQVKDSDVTPPQ